MVLLGAISLAAACERATTSSDVELAVSKARSAYQDGDTVALGTAIRELDASVECTVEPVDPDLARAAHLVQGLWVAEVSGAGVASPYLQRSGLAEQRALGFELYEREASLLQEIGPAVVGDRPPKLPPPLVGTVSIDGIPGGHPSNDEPYVFQLSSRGEVKSTHYVGPSGAPPAYVRRRPVLATATAVLAGLSAGLYYGGVHTRNDLNAPHDPLLTGDEVDAIQAANHRYLIGAGFCASLAVVSGGGLAFTYVR